MNTLTKESISSKSWAWAGSVPYRPPQKECLLLAIDEYSRFPFASATSDTSLGPFCAVCRLYLRSLACPSLFNQRGTHHFTISDSVSSCRGTTSPEVSQDHMTHRTMAKRKNITGRYGKVRKWPVIPGAGDWLLWASPSSCSALKAVFTVHEKQRYTIWTYI